MFVYQGVEHCLFPPWTVRVVKPLENSRWDFYLFNPNRPTKPRICNINTEFLFVVPNVFEVCTVTSTIIIVLPA